MIRSSLAVITCLVGFMSPVEGADVELPKVLDDRLKFELFAAEPQIVTPAGIAVDERGRVLVIESHTHFRSDDYEGPPTDRIRMFQDTDRDGRADRITTFFEGTTHTMNLAVYHDGSIYVATRGEIFRLRDSDDDGQADERTEIVRLDTAGAYPHNGLSGFAFDFFGNVYFSLGENLGAPYKLVGSDGTIQSGGGEGGSIYRCRSDGSELTRIATGFWNPFHLCRDVYGRLFAVDNDPDWRPPCRLLHIVPKGDYGYRYRLGRRGIHPFTSWFGQLPGTLGMVAGTGESPSGVIAYESDNLPDDYQGNLLVTAWGVHAIERYRLKRRGATFEATAEAIVKGGRNFRPVGIALAPDGSIFVSDWMDASYSVHGKGRIWRLSRSEDLPPVRETRPSVAIQSQHRPARQRAARALIGQGESGLDLLREQLKANNPPNVRASILTALVAAGDVETARVAALIDVSPEIRELAIGILPAEAVDPLAIAKGATTGAERAAALRRIDHTDKINELLKFFTDEDPFVAQAARTALLRSTDVDRLLKIELPEDADSRLNVVLVLRELDDARASTILPDLLQDSDPRLQFLAVKWIGEAKLKSFEAQLLGGLSSDRMSGDLFDAYLASIELLRETSGDTFEAKLQPIVAELLTRDDVSPAVIALSLRKLRGIETRQFGPSDHPALSVERLMHLVNHDDAAVQLEAVRSLREADDPSRDAAIRTLASDPRLATSLRTAAILGLTAADGDSRSILMDLITSADRDLRDEALRSLRGADLTEMESEKLREIRHQYPDSAALVDRLLDGQWKPIDRPQAEETDRWLGMVDGGNAAAGERIFFHSQGPRCFACHRIDGRGSSLGPDLSLAGRLKSRRLLESVLTPSREIAPRFVPWTIIKSDGRVFTGILVSERDDNEIYADSSGTLIYIDHTDIQHRTPSPKSIMPDGLVDQMTDGELRDLMAFMKAQK